MKLDDCTALITGASAGIGFQFARQLASRAKALILVARRGARLEELRAELTKTHPELQLHIRVVDLADKNQLDGLIDWLERENLKIDLLINNAGLGDLGPFATSDLDRNERIITVNMMALTLLTRALLPSMLARKHGAILNVSSSAGFLPIAHFAVYAASKAYVTSFSEALRMELRGTGISVTALCPGPVHTEFTDVAQRPGATSSEGPEFVYVSAEDVARRGLTAVERDKPLLVPGFFMKLGMLIVRATPMPVLRWTSRWMPHRG